MSVGPPSTRFLGSAGFTLTDLLVIVAVVSVLSAIGVERAQRTKQKSRLAQCTTNLKQVDQALLTFCEHNQQVLPASTADDPRNVWWWYKERVKGYAGCTGESSPNDKVFACPDDRGYSDPYPFHNSQRFDYSSYVFNGVTLPAMPNIAGLHLSDLRHPQRTLLVMEWTAHAPLSWHNSKTGRQNRPFYCNAQSVAGFVDGHVSFSQMYYDGYNAAYTQDPIDGYDYQYSPN
jgi:type II secretory pathway pseudopilin PulG